MKLPESHFSFSHVSKIQRKTISTHSSHMFIYLVSLRDRFLRFGARLDDFSLNV